MIKEMFKEMENCVVFRVGRGRRFGFTVGEEAGEASGAMVRVAEAEAGVSLTAATGGLIENGAVNLWGNDVVVAVKIEGRVGTEGECV